MTGTQHAHTDYRSGKTYPHKVALEKITGFQHVGSAQYFRTRLFIIPRMI